jgi:hypothetical protein
MDKNFEKELPEGYREVFSIDAKNKKTALIMSLAAFFITAALCVASWLIVRPYGYSPDHLIARYLIFLIVLLAYIVLHELVHGLAYKLLTGQKLTFGITFSAAYCGVPEIYVYRKTALISLLAPFTVFSVVFIALALIFRDPWDRFAALLAFSIHAGGCIGDLYDTFLYLTRFRDPRTLMQDTGPKQTFWLPED